MVVSDEYIEKHSWMVRTCQLYDSEYSDCTSMRSRIHQYFVTGKLDDCGPWKRDYNNCIKWTEKNDKRAFEELIDGELDRRKQRLSGHSTNDVWEKRSVPPLNWNDPLPPHIEKRNKYSYLAIKAQELKDDDRKQEKSLCVIS